jgi:hypothetical protein
VIGLAPEHSLDYMAAAAATEVSAKLINNHPCKPARKGETGLVKAEDADNLVTKALGVVQESGPFACCLYLLSRCGSTTNWQEVRAEAVVAGEVLITLLGLSDRASFAKVQKRWTAGSIQPNGGESNKKAILDHMVAVTGVELERLFLIKEVWEQTLTYLRYIARSMREKKD